MLGHRADADGRADEQLGLEPVFDRAGKTGQLFRRNIGSDLTHDGNVGFIDIDDKILLGIGEHVLQQLDGAHIRPAELADQKDHARQLRLEMQLLRADIDIPRQNIVGDDILDKGTSVMFFLIIGLGKVQGHLRHTADGKRGVIRSFRKDGKAEGRVPSFQRHESILSAENRRVRHRRDRRDRIRPLFPDQRRIAAGNYDTVRVDHTHRQTGSLAELCYNTLKNTTGHTLCPPYL